MIVYRANRWPVGRSPRDLLRRVEAEPPAPYLGNPAEARRALLVPGARCTRCDAPAADVKILDGGWSPCCRRCQRCAR